MIPLFAVYRGTPQGLLLRTWGVNHHLFSHYLHRLCTLTKGWWQNSYLIWNRGILNVNMSNSTLLYSMWTYAFHVNENVLTAKIYPHCLSWASKSTLAQVCVSVLAHRIWWWNQCRTWLLVNNDPTSPAPGALSWSSDGSLPQMCMKPA